MNSSPNHKILTTFSVAFIVSVVSLAILAVASFMSLDQYKQDTKWVKHAYGNIEKVNALLALAERATSINRAFLISGDIKLLTKRDQALTTVSETVDQLKVLAEDNPDQLRRINELDALLDEKAAELDTLAHLRINRGLAATQDALKKDPFLGLMDNIRKKVAEIEKHERELLTTRIDRSRISSQRTVRLIIYTTVFSIVLLSFSYMIIRKGLKEGRRTNLALEEAKRFAEGIVETVREPILVLDPNLVVIAANRSFHLLFQTTPSEIAGKALHRLGDGILDITSLRQLLQQSFEQSNEFRNFELVHNFPSLGRRVFLLNGRKIYQEGHLADTVLLAFDDVTEHRQREEEIRQLNGDLRARAAALERSNEELDTFNYSVSHDLRAPLRSISGFAEIISRRYSTNLPPEAIHYFDNIVSASVHMGQLIDDLLAYSKVGKVSIRHTPINLKHTLTVLSSEFEGRFADKGGSITIRDPIPFVCGDETFLHQLFSNLIDNAIIYQKPGNKPEVEISARTEGEWALIDVEDNGIGIPQEYQERIFQIFQRLHTNEEFAGTGLGLAIVKKTVTLMGGEVLLKSTPGLGSLFTIKLPLAKQKTESRATPS
jgi:signal transduction histidine kinase